MVKEQIETNAKPQKIDDAKPYTVCFVCTGNTCRSPMAAAVLNNLGKRKNIVATSAGLFVHSFDPISSFAVAALQSRGFINEESGYYSSHVATTISAKQAEACNMIVGMTSSHVMTLLSLFPQYASKIFVFEPEIPDPFGGDEDDYLNCLDKIISGIQNRLKDKL